MKSKPKTIKIEELLQLRERIYFSICTKPYNTCKNEWNRLGQIEDTLRNKHHIKRKYTNENKNNQR